MASNLDLFGRGQKCGGQRSFRLNGNSSHLEAVCSDWLLRSPSTEKVPQLIPLRIELAMLLTLRITGSTADIMDEFRKFVALVDLSCASVLGVSRLSPSRLASREPTGVGLRMRMLCAGRYGTIERCVARVPEFSDLGLQGTNVLIGRRDRRTDWAIANKHLLLERQDDQPKLSRFGPLRGDQLLFE